MEHDRVGWLVSLEDLRLDQGSVGRGRGTELLLDLIFGLSKCESFGLSEKVGKENLVMLATGDGVECLDGSEEITRDEFGSLVDELIEGVLTVGTALSPNDGLMVSEVKQYDSLQSRSLLWIHPWFGSFRSTPCLPVGSSRQTSSCTGRKEGVPGFGHLGSAR